MPDPSASQPLEAAPPAAAPAAARTLARVAGWGVVHFAIATFCSGLLLAWLYRRNRLERWTRGFAFTAGVHACSNALVTVALLVRPN
jgi:hypothetical protein